MDATLTIKYLEVTVWQVHTDNFMIYKICTTVKSNKLNYLSRYSDMHVSG